MHRFGWLVCALGVAAVGVVGHAPSARACGGLFCNNSNPVNQAAERIIFSENGDGTVTAIIEIQYDGPSERFAWVLPVPGNPEIGLSSVMALDRLQQATNPQYRLTTSFEDGCAVPQSAARGGVGTGAADADAGSGVTVLGEGTVGPFDYTTISLDPSLSDPADVAIEWLMENDYDVTALTSDVLAPYLEDGLNLVAFRLTKGNDTGSIRPIRLSYDGEEPFIPIRPTAVAANDDMGILVWVVGAERAIPRNYKSLELNDALIDWFNPMDTYNDVVSAAADEAGGQGFVTELAGDSQALENVIVPERERQQWTDFMGREYPTPVDLLTSAVELYRNWDGFQHAARESLTLPEGVTVADVIECPRCYVDDPEFAVDETALRLSLFEDVVRPMFRTEDLVQSRPYVTRLYTTMSADEMTLDPLFDFNPELEDVDNVHTAEQIMSCDGESGSRVVLPSGEVVFIEEPGVWPNEIDDQPAARRILQLSTEGQGDTVTDNRETIRGLLMDAIPAEQRDAGVFPPLEDAGVPAGDGGVAVHDGGDDDGGLCAVHRLSGGAGGGAWLLVGLAFGTLLWRRRRA